MSENNIHYIVYGGSENKKAVKGTYPEIREFTKPFFKTGDGFCLFKEDRGQMAHTSTWWFGTNCDEGTLDSRSYHPPIVVTDEKLLNILKGAVPCTL